MKNDISKYTGVAVPLGALRTEKSPFIGEYSSLLEFAEFCKKSGLSIIQLLPVLDSGTHSSPYSSLSAFALHPIYISLSRIPVFQGCLEKDSSFKADYEALLSHSNDARFDYSEILRLKEVLLRKLFLVIMNSDNATVEKYKSDFKNFLKENGWVKPYAIFKSLKYKYMQASWLSWKKEDRNLLQNCTPEERKEKIDKIFSNFNDANFDSNDVLFYVWEQFVADVQLSEVVAKIRELGIKIKCDLPILINEDSCDVWSTPEIFNMKLRVGSPPDGDNPTGQNWGLPVYDWAAQEKDDFAWWKLRLSLAEKYFDAYRLDHIPGFFRFWVTHEGEDTAELGGTVPNSTISQSAISKLGFSPERIRWLKEPHLSTEDFFRKTGDFEKTHAILSLFCERIGHEELWLFKKNIKSSADIRAVSLENFELDGQIQWEIKELLCRWFKNRTLIEIKKGYFIPHNKYGETRAWNTLNDGEKNGLRELFEANQKKQEKQWEKQAKKIFSSLISSTKMTPCGEDLGVEIECMPKVLDEFGILGLKVIRWCRNWREYNQPYEKFENYRKHSLVTTSVHDSTTLRQWWNYEKDSARAFCECVANGNFDSNQEFNTYVAEFVLSNCASTNGAWFVNPLQDWLYLDNEFYSSNPDDERINVPGSVTKFNWTWRMPVFISKLNEKSELIGKIQKIAEKHNK